jgi:excisionase family DNA binding protein
VAEVLLCALTPEEVALALAAADEVADRRTRRSRAGELAVERARYEADRAERAFHACEPENRLVARSLEARWETRLDALAETEKALAVETAAAPTLPRRAELEALTGDVTALWHAPTTAARDRKRLLRTLIADVTLLPEPDLSKARIGIRWHTGVTDEVTIARRHSIVESHRTDPAAVDLVRSLGPTHANMDLAHRLNHDGYLTGAGRPFDVTAVANLRSYHRIAPVGLLAEGEITVVDAAQRVGVTTTIIYGWVHAGVLTARRGPGGRICIPFDAEVEHACQQRAATSVHIARHATTDPPGEHEWTVKQVAVALEISTNVVYYWLETGLLDARKGPGSRWLITYDPEVEDTCRARIATSSHLGHLDSNAS